MLITYDKLCWSAVEPYDIKTTECNITRPNINVRKGEAIKELF